MTDADLNPLKICFMWFSRSNCFFLNYLNYYLKNFHRKFVSMKIRNFV